MLVQLRKRTINDNDNDTGQAFFLYVEPLNAPGLYGFSKHFVEVYT